MVNSSYKARKLESPREPAKIVAEIGCNHMGEFETAVRMIDVAKSYCNVDFVKFQKRNPTECLTTAQYQAPHPVAQNSFGKTYGEHREYLEFTADQHARLRDHCLEIGVKYSTSVWDVSSAREMAVLSPEYLKIPSAANLNFDMLAVLCDDYGGNIHISLGMTRWDEEEEIVNFLDRRGRAADTVLYACTSGYPVPFEDVCLLEIERLREKFGDLVGQIGFSGHHNGIAVDIAAYTIGVEWIERHFTLDRTLKGTDHAASLEPDGMRRVVRDVRNVSFALTRKPSEILDIELAQRDKLKQSARKKISS